MDVDICGVHLKNPVIVASGTYGFGEEYANYYQPSLLGGICTKGLTLEPREGNNGRRVHETPSGMLNSVGLQNPGIDEFICNILPRMRRLDTAIIANVGGSSVEDYISAVEKLNSSEIDMIELNISCPNVKSGGMAFGIKAKVAYDTVKEVRQNCKKPLMVKLSPNAEDIVGMAEECVRAGADALSLTNTFKAMAVDIKKRRAVFDNVYAGLSGPAIMPIALRMVHEVCKKVDVPVVGLGGIVTAEDAIAFIMAGAAAVQIGTANFANPLAALEVVEGIEQFMKENGISDLKEIRGII